MKSITIAAALALAAMSSAASAATFLFNYRASAGMLAGNLTGTLQADNNTVLISSVSNVTLAGASLPPTPFVDSFSNLIFGGGAPATTSFDGLVQDFIACSVIQCNDGFLIDTVTDFFGAPVVSSSISFGSINEAYNPNNWLLRSAAVPEPASWAMLIAGFGLIGASMRRRRTALAA